MKNARLIDTFQMQAAKYQRRIRTVAQELRDLRALAAKYQRRIRTVAQELRDLRALEHAQAFIAEHTGKPNQDLADAISVIEECIVDSLGLDHTKD